MWDIGTEQLREGTAAPTLASTWLSQRLQSQAQQH